MPVPDPLTALLAYLVLVAITSGASFVLYGFDKRRAGMAGRRVPERTLHLLAFLGGWPGALLGQRTFRHKTRKLTFLIVFWMIVVLHVALVATIGYALGTAPPPDTPTEQRVSV